MESRVIVRQKEEEKNLRKRAAWIAKEVWAEITVLFVGRFCLLGCGEVVHRVAEGGGDLQESGGLECQGGEALKGGLRLHKTHGKWASTMPLRAPGQVFLREGTECGEATTYDSDHD